MSTDAAPATAPKAKSRPKPKAVASPAPPPADPTAIDPALKRAVSDLDTLSDPFRLKLMLLCEAGRICVGDMAAKLGQSQPAVSHHLGKMKDRDIVQAEREGKNNFYTLTDRGRKALAAFRSLL